jgi:hypothetical protein
MRIVFVLFLRLRKVLALLSVARYLVDADMIRRYFCLYKEGGINGLLEIHYAGRHSFLMDTQKESLRQHLREHIYFDVKTIIEYVREMFVVRYSVSGMTKLLHELNFGIYSVAISVDNVSPKGFHPPSCRLVGNLNGMRLIFPDCFLPIDRP